MAAPAARGDAPDDGGPVRFGPYGPGGDMLLPSESAALRRARRPTARAGRAVRQRVVELFGAGGPAFQLLAGGHAASTAGDTLVAVALAGSLFFQVPSAEARGNVALYLLLTVAPFAVIGPLLGRVFDREGAERGALVWSSVVRVVAAAALVLLAGTIWLFPLAFALLVLSRVHGISRSALLPQALSTPIALVTANARLAQITVIAGGIAAPIGVGLSLVGSQAVLLGAAVAFGGATVQSMRLPTIEGARATEQRLTGGAGPGGAGPGGAGPGGADDDRPPWADLAPLPLLTPTPRTARFWRHGRRIEEDLGLQPAGGISSPAAPDAAPLGGISSPAAPDAAPLGGISSPAAPDAAPPGGISSVDGPPPGTPAQLRLARFATAVVRLLNGYLVLVLAFAFRDVDAAAADFGAVLAAAGIGFGLASVVAPALERRLREEPMVVAALAVEAAAAFITGQFFSLATAALLSLAAGYAWGTAKFAFDGLLQATVAPADRGRAFTRSETIFQLAWVLGAFLPTGIPIDVRVALIVAGVTALFAQTVYVSRLLQR